MTISGINANDPISLSESQNPQSALGKDAFMKLLVNQMKNQDPMAPADNSQMIAQLAQFSSLEEMQELNDNIVGLAVLQQGNALMSQLTTSSLLIGKDVKYVDPTTNAEAWGTVDSVKIADGQAVLSIDGSDIPLANVRELGGTPADAAGSSDDASDDNG